MQHPSKWIRSAEKFKFLDPRDHSDGPMRALCWNASSHPILVGIQNSILLKIEEALSLLIKASVRENAGADRNPQASQ
jgi:hypothetical protein